ncbi:SDR family NAD(P)-dependent oxidoreductase [Hydrogenophaga sp.]|uniref:SDR family NAD(P)-dependent oxidoreductase n=1 Tax=Hydrogenophaga sp. TaxID=1904254 RepID=UPI00271D45A5|nr:SDR family NAD(P)-dependent oxidoreductase [Hydrogenophaga sp.]MDO9435909.1 SDR family NAD(P)-dependent oxidoreductase [Hydrogenophaga sp.]
MNKTWFVTGCSSGFGEAIAREALAQGDRVVATARNPDTLRDLARDRDGACLTLALDVSSREQLADAVRATHARFGAVDVLVNNAGQGLVTSVEEASDADVRSVFELNFFSLVAVTRAFLPRMRERGSGHIINMSSIGGLVGRAGSGYYAASKFAVEGFSESLSQEIKPFGMRVTLVEPAGFRTRFASAMRRGEAGVYQDVADRLAQIDANMDRTPGDPVQAAKAIAAIAGRADAPLRLPLGKGAVDTFERKLKMLQVDLDAGRETALACDFDAGSR